MTNKGNTVMNDNAQQPNVLAGFLSLLFPGLGQMCKGKVFAAVGWLAIVLLGYVCFVIPGLILHLFCVRDAAMK